MREAMECISPRVASVFVGILQLCRNIFVLHSCDAGKNSAKTEGATPLVVLQMLRSGPWLAAAAGGTSNSQ